MYEADEVTVTFDPNLCIHAEECVRGLPAVFDPDALRWIRPERAPAADVLAVVARCPTGALRARARGTATPAVPPQVTIRVAARGPLFVRGPVRVESEAGETIAEAEAVALCRCGGTANPPFCDGSHERVLLQDGGHGP